jgi:Ni,Fe-hydrogenase III component G
MSQELVDRIRKSIGDKALRVEVRSPRRVYIDVAADDLVDVVKYLFEGLRARYAIASGVQVEDGFEVIHHFCFDSDHVVVSIRVKAAPEKPEVPSVAAIIKGADFIEREMHDLLGIEFPGHPNMARLILAEDWPEGVYPLRRGKPWEGKVRQQL